jgi:crossover junction endodeoxyribonuclease RuvC
VLGVDPGTAVMGYGVVATGASQLAGGSSIAAAREARVERVQLIECGVVRTRATESLAMRLGTLFDALAALIERHQPDAIAVEGLFHGRNARSALILGHARGVVLLAATRAGLAVAEISPAEVKRAVTGTGAATKTQVSSMVMRLLNLVAEPKPADAADGVAIALTHMLRQQPGARLTAARR